MGEKAEGAKSVGEKSAGAKKVGKKCIGESPWVKVYGWKLEKYILYM